MLRFQELCSHGGRRQAYVLGSEGDMAMVEQFLCFVAFGLCQNGIGGGCQLALHDMETENLKKADEKIDVDQR